jgi:hypothetical protein
MKNWRTTTAALAAAAFGYILFSPQYFPHWLTDLSKYAMLGGLAGMGIAAKDFNVHSNADEVTQSSAKEAKETHA